ncbi:MAG: nitroreductase family protein [Rikenellaceae bacterium]
MKNSWQILTLLLAIALVALSIKVAVTPSGNVASVAQEITAAERSQIALDAIMTRSSVRSYTSQSVEQEKIDILLKAAMAAPTAGNRQPWEFVVITDREVLDSIPGIIKAAQMVKKAPLAIVVCGVPAKSFAGDLSQYWIQDCSAATENLLVAANAIELGAVWCGTYPNDKSNRQAKLQALLNLPDGTIPLNVIAVGYPDSPATIKDKWMAEKVHYNRY